MNVTIVIPTLNRAGYLERTLRYFRSQGFQGPILVGDGADSPEVAQLCSSFGATHLHCQGLNQQQTFGQLADYIETPYAVYCGDDDFIVPDSIAACAAFLESDFRYDACRGHGMVVNASGVHGLPYHLEPYRQPVVTEREPVERIVNFLKHYAVSIFSVHRTIIWREMWKEARKMNDKWMGAEIAAGVVSAAITKLKVLDLPYLVRHIHPNRYGGAQGEAWFTSPEVVKDAARLIDQLCTLFNATGTDRVRMWKALQGYMVTGPEPTPKRVPKRFWQAQKVLQAPWFRPIDNSMVGRTLAVARPRILIFWGSPYTFQEVLEPELREISRKFDIVLAMTDHGMKPAIAERALALKERGVIADVLFLPVWGCGWMLQRHQLMAQLIPLLSRFKWDAFMAVSTAIPYERYFTDCICPDAISIRFWPHIVNTYLHDNLAQAMKGGGLEKPLAAIRKQLTPKWLFQVFDRYIYPWLLVRKTFPAGDLDEFSQIGTSFDAGLLFDERDVEDYNRIYGRKAFRAIEFPPAMQNAEKWNAVLMPFTIHNEKTAKAALGIYERDLKIVLQASGCREVHIREHPGRPNPWLPKFAEALCKRGVRACIVGASEPITVQAQRYKGVFGAVSAALRDVRLACNDVFVVGSTALSMDYTKHPEKMIRSIGWIGLNGFYDKSIFRPRPAPRSDLPSLSEVLADLLEEQRVLTLWWPHWMGA